MKRILTNAAVPATLAAALVAGPVAAATWDTNDDGAIDSSEFVTGYVSSDTFNRFDDNEDGRLTPRELGLEGETRTFRAADENGDGVIAPSEAGRMIYATYDEDGRDGLSEDEFGAYERDDEAGNTPLDDLAGPGPRVPK